MVDGGGRWKKAGRRQLGEIDKSESGAEGGCARCKQGEPKTEDLATLEIEGRRGIVVEEILTRISRQRKSPQIPVVWRWCKKEAGGGEWDRRVVSQARSVKPRCLNLSSVFFFMYTVYVYFLRGCLAGWAVSTSHRERGEEKKSQGKTLDDISILPRERKIELKRRGEEKGTLDLKGRSAALRTSSWDPRMRWTPVEWRNFGGNTR